MVTRTRQRILNTLVLAVLVFGPTPTHDASARATKQTDTSADCAFLEATFWFSSEKAGETRNAGNVEDAPFYTQLAGQAIDSARRGGCSWPGDVFSTT